MTFQEALKASQALKDEGLSLDCTVRDREGRPDIFWQGYKHLFNVSSEAYWAEYAPEIQAGAILIGPAAYNVENKIVRDKDMVGLYLGARMIRKMFAKLDTGAFLALIELPLATISTDLDAVLN